MYTQFKSQLKALGITTGNFPPQDVAKTSEVETLLPRITAVTDRFFTNFWFSGQPAINVAIEERLVQLYSKNFRTAFTLTQAVEMDEELAVTGHAKAFETWVTNQTQARLLNPVDYVL
jgi:hypothetical protein